MNEAVMVQGVMPPAFLLSRDDIEARIGAEPVIADGEPCSHFLIVKTVQDGWFTVIYARVLDWGSGLYDRRMDVVRIVRGSEDLLPLLASSITDCTILTDTDNHIQLCLETQGFRVHVVKWSLSCFQKACRDRFFNVRSQACYMAAHAIKQGRVSVLANSHQSELIAQASRIPYYFDTQGKIRMESREAMRSMGIKQTDLFDAISFGFSEFAHCATAPG